ncbi:hypothetical protein C8F01DRAFT_1281148 [Mycena amicta]|nr:hypothetical protein C8F01DRAFT_1281148 [Mycena amicta]
MPTSPPCKLLFTLACRVVVSTRPEPLSVCINGTKLGFSSLWRLSRSSPAKRAVRRMAREAVRVYCEDADSLLASRDRSQASRHLTGVDTRRLPFRHRPPTLGLCASHFPDSVFPPIRLLRPADDRETMATSAVPRNLLAAPSEYRPATKHPHFLFSPARTRGCVALAFSRRRPSGSTTSPVAQAVSKTLPYLTTSPILHIRPSYGGPGPHSPVPGGRQSVDGDSLVNVDGIGERRQGWPSWTGGDRRRLPAFLCDGEDIEVQIVVDFPSNKGGRSRSAARFVSAPSVAGAPPSASVHTRQSGREPGRRPTLAGGTFILSPKDVVKVPSSRARYFVALAFTHLSCSIPPPPPQRDAAIPPTSTTSVILACAEMCSPSAHHREDLPVCGLCGAGLRRRYAHGWYCREVVAHLTPSFIPSSSIIDLSQTTPSDILILCSTGLHSLSGTRPLGDDVELDSRGPPSTPRKLSKYVNRRAFSRSIAGLVARECRRAGGTGQDWPSGILLTSRCFCATGRTSRSRLSSTSHAIWAVVPAALPALVSVNCQSSSVRTRQSGWELGRGSNLAGHFQASFLPREILLRSRVYPLAISTSGSPTPTTHCSFYDPLLFLHWSLMEGQRPSYVETRCRPTRKRSRFRSICFWFWRRYGRSMRLLVPSGGTPREEGGISWAWRD